MDTLLEIYHRLLRETVPAYRRTFYEEFQKDSRFIGVIGARGVGKTTFLLHYLRQHYQDSPQALYVSADNLYFVEHTLLETVDQFVKDYDGQIICLDEVHKYKNWDQELKNIYDSYPNLQVIFSGSSSIDLIKGKADLSRRAVLKTMYGFSFREFLEVKTNQTYPVLALEDVLSSHAMYEQRLAEVPKLLGYLKEYWKEGYYPTRFELQTYTAYKATLRNIIDKIIYEDISSFYSLNTGNLDTLKKILYFFSTAQPGSLNINKIATSLKKDHTTIAEYIQILRDTGLLRFLLANRQGHALVRDAEKIYLENSNLLYAMNDELGKEPLVGVLRELFVIGSLQNAGYHVYFSVKGDIECNGITFEIGGKNKDDEQIRGLEDAYLVKDDVLSGGRKTLPLYLFGFLY
jgi:predicted AAA+ superfamily ATPase